MLIVVLRVIDGWSSADQSAHAYELVTHATE